MKLYKIEASNFKAFFGTPEEPIERDVITIAQTPSCDAFLYLSNETYDELELLDSVPAGFDFTYCQEWGLTVDDDVIDRVILDLHYLPVFLFFEVSSPPASMRSKCEDCSWRFLTWLVTVCRWQSFQPEFPCRYQP